MFFYILYGLHVESMRKALVVRLFWIVPSELLLDSLSANLLSSPSLPRSLTVCLHPHLFLPCLLPRDPLSLSHFLTISDCVAFAVLVPSLVLACFDVLISAPEISRLAALSIAN